MVTSGLVFDVDVANTKSYPRTGTTLTELVNSNQGTIYNTPTFSSTDAGGTFTFSSASSQYINMGSTLDNTFSAGITMDAWVKPTSYTVWNRMLTISDATGSTYQYWLQMTQTAGVIEFGTAVNVYTRGLTAVAAGTWVHIAATCSYGASSVKIYLNGVDDTGTSTGGSPTYTADVGTTYIGRLDAASVGYYGNFTFSNARIYNRVLSPDEMKQNFNATRNRFEV